ncbi:MAG: hypothetical protein PVH85_33710, partial [Desulfobacterales bacterium]
MRKTCTHIGKEGCALAGASLLFLSKESVTLATRGDPSANAGLVMAKPLYRKNPTPNYPRRARRKGYQGNVILEV